MVGSAQRPRKAGVLSDTEDNKDNSECLYLGDVPQTHKYVQTWPKCPVHHQTIGNRQVSTHPCLPSGLQLKFQSTTALSKAVPWKGDK